MRDIKNIIFDLGGVIVNLDTDLCISEFRRLSTVPFETLYTLKAQSGLFNAFDKGTIAAPDFFEELAKQLRYNGEHEDLAIAWNSMLRGVPEERLDVLIAAQQSYNTFVISNTNEVHVAAFEKDLYQTNGVRNFHDYFDKIYYSCRMGMRKPDQEIFEHVLNENGLVPSETVFIDDSITHVKAAGECGINAHLLPPNMEVGDFLKELKLL